MIDVLNSGSTGEYYRTFQMIEPELADRECRLAWNILDMFRAIECTVRRYRGVERLPR